MYWPNNRIFFVVLIASLLFAFCVTNAKALVYEKQQQNPYAGGEVNAGLYWKFNLSRAHHDLAKIKVSLYAYDVDREDEGPLWEIKNRYGTRDKIGDIWGNGWYSKEFTNVSKYVVNNSYIEFGVRCPDESGDDGDVWVRHAIVEYWFKYPSLWLSDSSRDFGNLYFSNLPGATDYNKGQTRTIRLKNTGDSDTTLKWEISGVTGVNFSRTSGTLGKDQEVSITVWLNPPEGSPSSFSKTITITGKTNQSNVDVGSRSFSVSAKVYGTPDNVSHQKPAKGSNNKVNVTVDESTEFGVSSGNPLFPGAKIKGYQWQDVRGTNQPDNNRWQFTSGAKKNFRFSDAVDYTLYCRMVDTNSVSSAHVSIPIRAWKRPIVKSAPPSPDNVDWFDNTYAGVVNKLIKLQADANLNGNESIAKYIWLNDAGNTLVEQNAGQVVTYQWDRQNLNGRVY